MFATGVPYNRLKSLDSLAADPNLGKGVPGAYSAPGDNRTNHAALGQEWVQSGTLSPPLFRVSHVSHAEPSPRWPCNDSSRRFEGCAGPAGSSAVRERAGDVANAHRAGVSGGERYSARGRPYCTSNTARAKMTLCVIAAAGLNRRASFRRPRIEL